MRSPPSKIPDSKRYTLTLRPDSIPLANNQPHSGPPPSHRERRTRTTISPDDHDVEIALLHEQLAYWRLQVDVERAANDDVALKNDLAEWRAKFQEQHDQTQHVLRQHLVLAANIQELEGLNEGLRRQVEDREEVLENLRAAERRAGSLSKLQERIEHLEIEQREKVRVIEEREREALGLRTRIAGMARQVTLAEDRARERAKEVEEKLDVIGDLFDQLTLAKEEISELEEMKGVKVPFLEQPPRQMLEHGAVNVVDYALENQAPKPEEDLASIAELQAHVLELEQVIEKKTVEHGVRNFPAQYVESLELDHERLREAYNRALEHIQQGKALLEHSRTRIEDLELQCDELIAAASSGQASSLASVERDYGPETAVNFSPVASTASSSLDFASVTSLHIRPVAPSAAHAHAQKQAELLATLDLPINITITVLAPDKKGLTLLQRMKSAISKTSALDIHGPKLVVDALVDRLKALDDHSAKSEQVERQRKLLVDQQKEIGWLERALEGAGEGPACTFAAQRALVDQIGALEARLEIQHALLRDQGNDLMAMRAGEGRVVVGAAK